MKSKTVRLLLLSAVLSLVAAPAIAGPFILAGTDADDHGSGNATTNFDGWFFMQRALENLAAAPSLTNGNFLVANLGSDTLTTASSAAASAFTLSSLPGAGWSFANVDGTTDLEAFFDGTGATNVNNTGIIMMDSGGGNVFGGTSASELAIFTTNAAIINSFLGGGGGLFSQSNSYGWVSSLLPGLDTPDEFLTGINLTADGNSAFPGLTNADLGAGPYHNRFENFGGLSVFGVGASTQSAIIIGASGGSVTDPDPPTTAIPETSTVLLVASGLLGLVAFRRRFRH
ncbi:MAG: hypothetical protein WD733_09895 [Bryobacterales bacterium]